MAENHPVQWLWSRGNAPLFSNATVLHLAGPRLTPATLQNWANRGIIDPTIATKNVKGRRRYSSPQMMQVVLGHQLVDHFEIPPAAAMDLIVVTWANLLQALLDHGVRDPKTKNLQLDFSLVEKFWAVYRASPKDLQIVTLKDIPRALKDGKYSFVFPAGAEFHQLAERAMRVHAEQQNVDDEDNVFEQRERAS